MSLCGHCQARAEERVWYIKAFQTLINEKELMEGGFCAVPKSWLGVTGVVVAGWRRRSKA
jgi:hypothetical protein